MTLTTQEAANLTQFVIRAHAQVCEDYVCASGFDYLGGTRDEAGQERIYAEVELHYEDPDGNEMTSKAFTNNGAGLTCTEALAAFHQLLSAIYYS